MKKKFLLLLSSMLLLSGCVGIPDAEGWRYGQKSEFLKILEEDKYSSICDEQELYANVKESHNSKLLSKLLVAYTKNLANGCIDLESFAVLQEERNERKIETHYGTYLQEVKASDIMMQIKGGQTIEQILKPYVPEYKQFHLLTERYKNLKSELNSSKETLDIVRLNIERLKLMKTKVGENYALVNIPEFVVRIIEKDKEALCMAVVVGKKHMQTPVFSADIQYVTLNPQWSVPDSIARNEIIPSLIKDPEYLKKHRMVIRTSYDLNSKVIDQNSVDWKAYLVEEKNKKDMKYKFIEIPSKRNGLGRVKYIFPNQHSVYMHDTQSKSLFKRKVRTYSHGCIRLSKPVDLLNHISDNYTFKTNKDIKTKYNSLKTHHIGLEKRLPVHTAYLTAYIDKDAKLLMFNDIYGFDRLQKLYF